MSSSISRQDHDLGPPPWPFPPWHATTPLTARGSARLEVGAVCSPPTRERRARSPTEAGSSLQEKASGEREGIHEFFGQLWAIDSPPPPPKGPRVPRVHLVATNAPRPGLFWVRKILVVQGKVTPGDCFPVRRSDILDKPPVSISFTRDIWGQGGVKETYTGALRKPMEEEGRWIWEPRRQPPRKLIQN